MNNKIFLLLKAKVLLILLLITVLNTSFANQALDNVVAARKENATFNYQQADKHYALALKQNQNSPELLQEYLLFLVHQNKLDQSVKIAKQILAIYPEHFLSNMVVFVSLINQNKLNIALENLTKLEYIDGTLADFIFKITNATVKYINQENNDLQTLAYKLQNTNLNLTGEFDDFYEYHSALLDLAYNNKEQALDKLNKLTVNAVTIQSVLLYSQLLYKEDKPKAILVFSDYLSDSFTSKEMTNKYLNEYKKVNLNTFFSSVFLKLSALVDNTVNFNHLTSEYSTMVSLSLMLNNNNYPAYIALASHYYTVGDIDRSASLLTSIPVSSYYARISTYDIIEMLKFNNKEQELLKYLNKIASVDSSNPFIYLEKGHYYHTKKQYNTAIKEYIYALNLANKQGMKLAVWLSYYFKGISEDRNGNWKTAEKDLLNALAIDNQDPLLVNYLAYSWLIRDINIERAVVMLNHLISTNSNNYAILDSYAYGLLKIKDYKNAIVYSKKAYKINPYDATVANNLADLYWLTGDKENARYYWNLAINFSITPDLKDAINDKLNNNLPNYLR